MSAVKARCRLAEPQVQERHQFECKWHSHACDMESEMIRHDRARKRERVAVEGKKYTSRQNKTVLLLASLIPCRPRVGELSIHGQ
eukprot:3628205-Amphidinium_carterae.1